MGLTGERDALVILDRAEPNYIDCFPLMSRHNADAYGALKEFFGDVVPKRIYTDNAIELIRIIGRMGLIALIRLIELIQLIGLQHMRHGLGRGDVG